MERGKIFTSIIVENRRAVKFDKNINIYGYAEPGGDYFTTNENYGKNGGILIWQYTGINVPPGLRVVEADGKYDLTRSDFPVSRMGSPEDFFENQYFTPWTFPGDYTWVTESSGYPFPWKKDNDNHRGQPVLIKVPAYTNASNVNRIDLVSSGGRFASQYEATENNNQRKILHNGLSSGFNCAMVHESEGRVFASLSDDGGNTWKNCQLVSDIQFGVNGVGEVQRPASGASLAWFNNSFWVVYQELVNGASGLYDIRLKSISTSHPWTRTIATNVTKTDGKPTPAIAYGYYDPDIVQGGKTIVKVVYSTDEGLMESNSYDGLGGSEIGLSWTTPTHVPQTTSTSIRPSLAMYVDPITGNSNMILIWQDARPNSFAGLPPMQDIFFRKNDESPENLTIGYPLQNHTDPSVVLDREFVHVVWTASAKERVGGSVVIHRKAVHTVWNIVEGPSSKVFTFFNRKYNRDEASKVPVIASTANTGIANDMNAATMWSVFDPDPQHGGEGARLRSNRFYYEPTQGQYVWSKVDHESALSSEKTRFPAMTRHDGDARFIVVHGNSYPYRLRTPLISADPPASVPWPKNDRIILFNITNSVTKEQQVEFHVHPPVLTDGQNSNLFDISGIPSLGFDGSPSGPGLSALTRTEPVLMHQSEGILWDIEHRRDSAYFNPDTLHLTGFLIDAATDQVIGLSNTVKISPYRYDTTMTIGFELPPSHFPMADVRVAFQVQHGVFDDPQRFINVVINNLSEDPLPKRVATHERNRNGKAKSLRLYPQPATDVVTLQNTVETDGYVQFVVTDVLGREVRKMSAYRKAGVHEFTVHTSEFKPGLYVYHYQTASCMERGSFVIVK